MSKVLTDQIEKRTGGTAMDVPAAGKWPTANIADDAIGTAQLSATGTADATTFLRGDNAWTEVVMGLTWEAVQTASFTAVAGKAYPLNTTSGAMNVTLPASPSVGDEVLVLDYAGTFDTNAATVLNNGSNILGDTSTVRVLTQEYQTTRFRYIDATLGWAPTGVANGADIGSPEYVAATGPDGASGVINGDYRVHTFTASKSGSNAFNVSSVGNVLGSNTIEYLVIAGGGGGGGQHGGGGGAGGYLNATSWTLSGGVGYYDITIGAGGAGSITGSASSMPAGGDGNDSVWASNQPGPITAVAGGGGGSYRQPLATGVPGVTVGRDGGSGGGGGSSDAGSGFSGPGGNATPNQGYDGGKGRYSGGGGGGAGAVGGQAEPDPWGPTTSSLGGAGGVGLTNDITGSGVFRGGGGGGGAYNNTTGGGAGGNGGGAAGSSAGGHPGGTPAVAGTANTGGGGGGGALGGSTSASNGGSGVVIITYKFQN